MHSALSCKSTFACAFHYFVHDYYRALFVAMRARINALYFDAASILSIIVQSGP